MYQNIKLADFNSQDKASQLFYVSNNLVGTSVTSYYTFETPCQDSLVARGLKNNILEYSKNCDKNRYISEREFPFLKDYV